MKLKLKSIFTACCLLSLPLMADDQGLLIAQKMDQADTGWGDEIVSSNMVLRSPDGKEVTRVIQNRSLEVAGDGDKSVILFDRPRDVKGTVFLSHSHKSGDDDQWLFIPALKRVKRISSSNRAGPFMGSEFAYEDVSSEEVERYSYRLEGEDKCAEQLDCYLLIRVPKDESSGYSKQRVYLDKIHYRIHKIEYYDRKNSLLKTLVRSDYEQIDRFWRANKWSMLNHQTGKSTHIEWYGRVLGSGLKVTNFNAGALTRIR